MIMDEVLAVGDMAFQRKCLDKMREVAQKEGRTVLYVSHNMNTIRRLCDRCIVLEKGKLIFDGDVEDAIEIYMHKESVRNEWTEGMTECNFSDTSARSPYSKGGAMVTYLKLLDSTDALYSTGEKIRFRMRVHSKQAFKDLRLRLEVLYGDDAPVGTMPSVSLGEMAEGEIRDFTVAFDPIGLTSGKYRVDLVLFDMDEFGTVYDQELLLPAFRVEIKETTDINWNSTNWGHIRFPDARVE